MLTPAQYQALKTDMLAQPSLATAIANGDDPAIADFYNGTASPAYVVWRTWVSKSEATQSGSGIVWSEVDSLTVGKARIWEWMTASQGSGIGGSGGGFNPSQANVRQGLADCFGVGTTTRTNLLAMSKRNASVFEKLFATGAGTSANPSVMSVEGPLSASDASIARGNF